MVGRSSIEASSTTTSDSRTERDLPRFDPFQKRGDGRGREAGRFADPDGGAAR
jgi:hypothetical protein